MPTRKRKVATRQRSAPRLVERSPLGPAGEDAQALARDELRRVRQELALKVFELRNLIDMNRDLSGGPAEEAILELAATTVMGHFVVSRCALYLLGPGGLALALARGLRREPRELVVPLEDARVALSLAGPVDVAGLPEGLLRRRLEEDRFALAVPLAAGTRVEGLLGIGERSSGTPFSEQDRQIALTLARQTLAALEKARLQRVREEKLRQDRELQIARETQQSLLPARPPELAGFEVAGVSHPCYEVGGDGYDWIALGSDRLALVVADVAGKGTPASLLMASAHAFVHALAGTAPPAQLVHRLNRFLFAKTQTSRFVTLFYAELDAPSGRLAYVNAGHVPPFRLQADGTLSRLRQGGPALGLIEEASYDIGELRLEPEDVVAIVTDGVTEALSPDEREFGDERVGDTLRGLTERSASQMLTSLVAAVTGWAGGERFGDDLTALVLRGARQPRRAR